MRAIQTARKTTTVRRSQQREQLKTEKRLRVVDERSSRKASLPEIPFPIFVLFVTVLTAGLIVNVAQQALVSQLSYEIDGVKREIQLAQQTQEKLLAQKAKLESPQRIELIATEKLCMVKAPKISYLRIADDASNSDAAKASSTSPVDSFENAPGGASIEANSGTVDKNDVFASRGLSNNALSH